MNRDFNTYEIRRLVKNAGLFSKIRAGMGGLFRRSGSYADDLARGVSGSIDDAAKVTMPPGGTVYGKLHNYPNVLGNQPTRILGNVQPQTVSRATKATRATVRPQALRDKATKATMRPQALGNRTGKATVAAKPNAKVPKKVRTEIPASNPGLAPDTPLGISPNSAEAKEFFNNIREKKGLLFALRNTPYGSLRSGQALKWGGGTALGLSSLGTAYHLGKTANLEKTSTYNLDRDTSYGQGGAMNYLLKQAALEELLKESASLREIGKVLSKAIKGSRKYKGYLLGPSRKDILKELTAGDWAKVVGAGGVGAGVLGTSAYGTKKLFDKRKESSAYGEFLKEAKGAAAKGLWESTKSALSPSKAGGAFKQLYQAVRRLGPEGQAITSGATRRELLKGISGGDWGRIAGVSGLGLGAAGGGAYGLKKLLEKKKESSADVELLKQAAIEELLKEAKVGFLKSQKIKAKTGSALLNWYLLKKESAATESAAKAAKGILGTPTRKALAALAGLGGAGALGAGSYHFGKEKGRNEVIDALRQMYGMQ
jgi:hypothetical protein